MYTVMHTQDQTGGRYEQPMEMSTHESLGKAQSLVIGRVGAYVRRDSDGATWHPADDLWMPADYGK